MTPAPGMEPPFIGEPVETDYDRFNGTAPHFYTRRPIHLCADDRPDDDEGPPNWGDRDAE